jgi:diguanylate cyclase (GGDEF)-like protein
MTKFSERRRSPAAGKFADVQVEMTGMVFHKLLPTVFIGCGGAVSAMIFMARHYVDPFLWWLTGATLLACGVRVALILRFRQAPQAEMTPDQAYRWELLYGILTIVYTSTLAVGTLYNFQYHGWGAKSWCAIGTFAFCSGISARLALRPWMAKVSGLIMLLALGFSVLRSDDVLVRWSAVSVVLYGYLYCESIDSKFDVVVDHIRVRRQLAKLADHDALTGLANRRHFEYQLARLVGMGTPFALLFIDLDRFKQVNDTHGHSAGDCLLQSVADRLRSAVRSSDLVARIGGDEFAVLQSSQGTAESARALATLINGDMAAPFEIRGQQLQIGASIGIHLSNGSDSDAAAILNNADNALYLVKRSGGGGFSFAKPAAQGSLRNAS